MPRVKKISSFTSPLGGAPRPTRSQPGEIIIELITRGQVYDQEQEHLRGEGWAFVAGPGEETIFRSPPDRHYECVVFLFEASNREGWNRQIPWNQRSLGTPLAFEQEIMHAFHHGEMVRDVLGDYLWNLFRYLQARRPDPDFEERLPEGLAELLRKLELSPERPWTVRSMAKASGMSEPHLYTQLKRYTGRSPHQHLIDQRMKRARQLLASCNAPLKAIAFEVGYPNVENFCRRFKAHEGMTAATYRRRYTFPNYTL